MNAKENQSNLPGRITDLIRAKETGSTVSCRPDFEIVPVEFAHREYSFHAYIFLCRYSGRIDGIEYSFRKCYARGCKHNRCLHVWQAVMIANRHLQRDYHRLEGIGIEVGRQLFNLEEMTVKFDQRERDQGPPVFDIYDFINLAKEGTEIAIEARTEYVPAVEYFEGKKNSQVFLMARFNITCLGEIRSYERCLACYPTGTDDPNRKRAAEIADARLHLLYHDFDAAAIRYRPAFFS